MKPLHTPITEFSLLAIDGYLREQIPLLVEQRLQQSFPGWIEPCTDHSAPGSKAASSPAYSKWLNERLEQHWTTSVEPMIQQSVQAVVDQLHDALLARLTEALTPGLKMLVKFNQAQASITK